MRSWRAGKRRLRAPAEAQRTRVLVDWRSGSSSADRADQLLDEPDRALGNLGTAQVAHEPLSWLFLCAVALAVLVAAAIVVGVRFRSRSIPSNIVGRRVP